MPLRQRGEPDAATRHNALTYAREHLRTHTRWINYLRAGGEIPHEKVGDLEHHQQAVKELNTICAVLRWAVEK